VSPVVEDVEWWRWSVPNGWYWIGYGEIDGSSPVEFSLPREIVSGTKLVCIGCRMADMGMVADDWLVAEAAA
jgi:hypothetical protein